MSNQTSGSRRRGRSATAPLCNAIERLSYAIESISKAVAEQSATLRAPHLRDAKDYVAAARGDVLRATLNMDKE